MKRPRLLILFGFGALAVSVPAQATPLAPGLAAHPTTFALIIGVNHSADPDLRTLHFADDDAARYQELFGALGARTHLLARFDDPTRLLHPAAARVARPPVSAQLDEAVASLAREVAEARAAGGSPTLYVVYAGHGNVDGEHGYLTLEDRRVTGADLEHEIFDRVQAPRSHLIVDACSSYLLVVGRGRGGERQPLHGFAEGAPSILRRKDIGFLLSTSSARESYEWNKVEAGVFNHEVRSGLLGAADADGDGVIRYPEMAAFIERANEGILNARYRPDVFWRPPDGSDALADIRPALDRRVEITAPDHGRYYVEDDRGVRIADFHSGATLAVHLLRPRDGRIYLHRMDDDREYAVPAEPMVVRTSQLTPGIPRVAGRGAADEAFSALFALPFDRAAVDGVTPRAFEELTESEPALSTVQRQHRLGVGLVALALPVSALGLWTVHSAQALRDGVTTQSSQTDVANRNQRIRTRDYLSGGAFGFAGAAALIGLVLLLPDGPPVTLSASSQELSLHWRGSF